jgi:hypothetical protein
MSRVHLSRVFLDNFRRTDMRLVWIFPELASGSALAQQIPALIELDLDFLQTLLFIVRKRASLEKLVLFINKALNVIHHALILVCHACLLFYSINNLSG